MASYILYGKDENGQNAIQRNETIDKNKRFKSYRTKDDSVASLDEVMENPMFDEQQIRSAYQRDIYTTPKPTIQRPRYDKKTGEMIDPGDSDIPGMTELWDTIDRWEHYLHVLQGKVPPDENITNINDDPYHIYLVKHNLIDIRRGQYYLKDAYKPELHFQKLDHPKPQFYDWCGRSAYWISYNEWQHRVTHSYTHTVSQDLKDYETRGEGDQLEVLWVVCEHDFDWENIQHIRALMTYYDALKEQVGDKLNTYGITLIWDFERYCKLARLSPMRMRLLQLKFEKWPYDDILDIIEAEYGIRYDKNHLSVIMNQEIPKKIATVAKRERLLVETPRNERKTCIKCGRSLPRDLMFFSKHTARGDGFSTMCKECNKKMRVEKGVTATYDDGRSKDPTMPKVPQPITP